MRRVSGGLVLVAIVGLWLDLAETDALIWTGSREA